MTLYNDDQWWKKFHQFDFATDAGLSLKEFLFHQNKSVNVYCQLQEGHKIIGSQNLHILRNDTWSYYTLLFNNQTCKEMACNRHKKITFAIQKVKYNYNGTLV